MANALSEFKDFILKGDVVSMAVGIVIGLAFNAVIQALVADLITPLIGVFGHFDFSAWKTTVNGSTFLQGSFLNALISFITIALVIFFLIVRPYEQMKARAAKKAPAPRGDHQGLPILLHVDPLEGHAVP